MRTWTKQDKRAFQIMIKPKDKLKIIVNYSLKTERR